MTDNKHKMLQIFYSGVLADSVMHYEAAGILESVTAKKSLLQKKAAPVQLKQLEINTIEKLFTFFSQVFGCIDWKIQKKENGYETSGTSCMLCAVAKLMGIKQPCAIYCINPFRCFVEVIEPGYILKVNETLWDGKECKFSTVKKDKIKEAVATTYCNISEHSNGKNYPPPK